MKNISRPTNHTVANNTSVFSLHCGLVNQSSKNTIHAKLKTNKKHTELIKNTTDLIKWTFNNKSISLGSSFGKRFAQSHGEGPATPRSRHVTVFVFHLVNSVVVVTPSPFCEMQCTFIDAILYRVWCGWALPSCKTHAGVRQVVRRGTRTGKKLQDPLYFWLE